MFAENYYFTVNITSKENLLLSILCINFCTKYIKRIYHTRGKNVSFSKILIKCMMYTRNVDYFVWIAFIVWIENVTTNRLILKY